MLYMLDFVSTVVQNFFIAYILALNLEDKSNRRLKLFLATILGTLISSEFILSRYSIIDEFQIFVTHSLSLLIIWGVFKRNIWKLTVYHSIGYLIIQIYILVFSNFIALSTRKLFMDQISTESIIYLLHTCQVLYLLNFIFNVSILKNLYKFIVFENIQKFIVIATIVLDFVLKFYDISTFENNSIFNNLIQVIFIVILSLMIIYFNNIRKKSKRISALNQSLEEKNCELRKIKHDYGAQISYLYGLLLMDRQEELKKSFKSIIDRNESILDAVEVNVTEKNKNSVFALALKPAVESGIHVILEECDLSAIKMKELELFRVISNIVSNAIKAMEGHGVIMAKSYECFGNLVIKIQNNGPKIPEDHIKDIFQSGFTTKENRDNSHGYGLSIVKELVEKYDGKISVKSTEENTEFKMVFRTSTN